MNDLGIYATKRRIFEHTGETKNRKEKIRWKKKRNEENISWRESLGQEKRKGGHHLCKAQNRSIEKVTSVI